MKKTTLHLLLLLLFTVTIHAQTTYTYSGSGDWSNTANWSPSYPGTIINAGDTVVITSGITIDETITNDGTLEFSDFVNNPGTITNNGTLNISQPVNYTGSIINTTTGTINTTGNIHIHNNITNNGTFINNGNIHLAYFVNLDGSGTVTNNETLSLDGNIASSATLEFTNSGIFNISIVNFNSNIQLINTSTGTINTTGSVDINCDFTNNGTLTNDGTLWIFGDIDGSGAFVNNGTLDFEGHTDYNNSLTYTNNGIINLNGLIDGPDTLINLGTLNINGGEIALATFTNTATGTITTTGNSYWRADLTNDGTITNYGTLRAIDCDFNGSGYLTNDGILELPNMNIGANLTITNLLTGDYITSGVTHNYSYNFTNEGTLTVLNGTFESVHCTNNGTITVNNSGTYKNTSQLFNTGTLNNNGTLTGVNTDHTGNFSNSGILSPGNSSGTYTFSNDYTHETTATLLTELESTTSYDKVYSYGNANLNGTLNVSLLNGFTPSVGDSFTILTASNITGTFDTVNLPAGYDWNVSYTATEVILEVANTLSTLDFELIDISLYPNPASNFITISGLQTEENYTIYNTLGQEVKNGSVTNNAKIDIQNLNTGLYFLKFENDTTIKFLKE